MAADGGIIAGMVLLIIMLLVINVYILGYYTHPEDKNQSYLAKALVILGLQLSTMSILMLPIDVSNNMGDPSCDSDPSSTGVSCGRVNFYTLWETLFDMMGFILCVCIPFAIFYYGAEEKYVDEADKKNRTMCASQFCRAFMVEIVVVAAILAILLACYYTSAKTTIPVAQVSTSFSNLQILEYTAPTVQSSPYTYINQFLNAQDTLIMSTLQTTYVVQWIYSLNFSIYLTGLFGWCGFWIFSVFCGAGLAALPFDMIMVFVFRPFKLAPEDIANLESDLQERTNELIEVATLMKQERKEFKQTMPSTAAWRGRGVANRVDLNRLTQMVFILERDVDEFRACKSLKDDYGVLRPYFYLIGGCVLGFVSVLWVMHMMVYMLPKPPPTLFLNAYFLWFNTWFPILGQISYGLFALYLLFCTIKGCIKFGLACFCVRIYPVKINETHMDAFLFNLGLVLVCTIPVIHFCTLAFAGYAVFSDVYLIFGVQIFYLQGFSTFYVQNVFTYFILLTSVLTVGYLCYRPRDVAFSSDEFKDGLHRRGAEEGPYASGDIRKAFGRFKGKGDVEEGGEAGDPSEDPKVSWGGRGVDEGWTKGGV